MKTKPYHHGDLRAELIRIGLEHLARGPASAIGLREIAREAGVSATAVYRHFPDKQALEDALCDEGGAQFGTALAAASAAAPNRAQARLIAQGRAYVRFALANPSLFRLMMTSAARGDPFAQEETPQTSGLALLRRTIADVGGAGVGNMDERVRAVRAWALVHGLAMLMLDGQIPADEGLIDVAIDESVAI